VEHLQCSPKAAAVEVLGRAHNVRVFSVFVFDIFLYIEQRVFDGLHVLNRRCRMHLGSVLCSTVANDSHYKVRCLPPYSLRFTDFITASQVIKSACVAARHVPSSAIIPKGVKDVASRFGPSRMQCCVLLMPQIT